MTGGRGGGRTVGQNAQLPGFTLVELMVVLVILGVLASVSVTALPSLRSIKAPGLADRLGAARSKAIRTGVPERVSSPHSSPSSSLESVSSVGLEWRFLPDGRVLGPGLDPRNGHLVDANSGAERVP
jgi:prepilin-type N-terminal cleavage/methylation domain-containing protein